jgi:cytochrome c oxidase subunit I+III
VEFEMTQASESVMSTAAEQRFTETWESPSGLYGWIATVNSRPLGKSYMITALSFFVVAVVFALLMRAQLAFPNNTLLGPDSYNAIFTMHGSTMLYLFAVPFMEGLGLYLLPMLIGARDVAFPRLTSFGYWLYLFGGLTMYASFLFGVVPDAGWTAYTPLSGPKYSGPGLDFWLLGLSMTEVAGLGAAIEIVVTILKFRAPGMSIRHMPPLVWAYLVSGIMIIFAFTPLLLATLLLEMDRSLSTQFFNTDLGGSSLLWQHLFWFFGHPEVYIIFLPATGVVSMVVPVFARRRLVAYTLIVVAVVTTGFVSFGLWTHHMFTAGLPDLSMLFFAAASMMLAIASGAQIFAWIATLWGSRPSYSLPLLYVLGFFVIFVNGGLTGVMVAAMPFDWQVHDTNFVVAHFHHVLIGGAVFPFLAGLHYWLPKITGRMFSEFWGRIGFGITFVGFNVTFLPMYVIGLYGMRRRVFTYPEEMGVGSLNFISSVGAFVLAAGFVLTVANLAWNAWRGRTAGKDPWKGGTLEWSVSSPPPPYGFQQPPVVRDLFPEWQSSSESDSEQPMNPRLVKLNTVAALLDCKPVGWRATLLTDATNGNPQALQYLPTSTTVPFFAGVAVFLAAIAFLAKSFITAGVMALVALVVLGIWIKDDPVLPEDEATDLAARLELPLLSSGRQSVGWWGMLGLLSILAMVLGSLAFSYFYLRLYSEQWPQGRLPRPDFALPLMAYGLLLAGGIAQGFSSWAWRRKRSPLLILGTSATIILGLGFIAVEMAALLSTAFLPTANAYASIFFTLDGFALLTASSGIALLAGTLVRVLREEESLDTPRLVLWLQNSELFWFFAVATGLSAFLIIYVSPHVL